MMRFRCKDWCQMYTNCFNLFNENVKDVNMRIRIFTNCAYYSTHLPEKWGYIRLKQKKLDEPEVKQALAPFRIAVKEQDSIVRNLIKDDKQLEKAKQELQARKKLLENKITELTSVISDKDKRQLRMGDLLNRRFYYCKSNNIYKGVDGFCDLGPPGSAIKTNILNMWRNYFIVQEQMLEISTPIITPEAVFKASGHVDRFSEFLVEDTITGDCFRLDHFIKSHLENLLSDVSVDKKMHLKIEEILAKLPEMTKDELLQIVKDYKLKSQQENPISGVEDFNLMFDISIGPRSKTKGFLRPELAQGIFVNFKQLLDYQHCGLPFAVAQIGSAFRNEISPQSGLLRMREFTLAEIEHFFDPEDNTHSKFDSIANQELSLLSADAQEANEDVAQLMTVKKAMEQKILLNESLAYLMTRTHMFLKNLGIDETRLRFRQHRDSELAHYANDCWDVECETYYGWLECVGCANRSSFDLEQHLKTSGIKLTAQRKLSEPITVEVFKLQPRQSLIKKSFPQDFGLLMNVLSKLENKTTSVVGKSLLDTGKYLLKHNSKEWILTEEMISVNRKQRTLTVEDYVPHVIEISFGIERIMHTIFEHTFRVRENDEKKAYFSLPPCVAPTKCSILPVVSKPEFEPFLSLSAMQLKKFGIMCRIDASSKSIGDRYRFSDELSVPFGVTIDSETLQEPHTVTLRHRDTTKQIRVPIQELGKIVCDLTNRNTDLSWEKAEQMFASVNKGKNIVTSADSIGI